MNYELIDFGDQCLPSHLIGKILSYKKKHIFMKGNYSFNNFYKIIFSIFFHIYYI